MKLTEWFYFAIITVFFASALIISFGTINAVAESSGLSGVYLYGLYGMAFSFLLLLFWVSITVNKT